MTCRRGTVIIGVRSSAARKRRITCRPEIIDATEYPTFSVTSIALPKNEYDVDPRKVPGFLT